MRKMFTRLFGLALLLCMMGFVTELSAQCDVPPLAESNVELVTDPADVCDSAYITYQVVGFTDAEYAFNLDDDLSGWGGFTSDSTVAVKEGVPFRIMVRMNDTCYSNELYYTDVNLIEPVVIDTPEVEHPQCFGDDGEVTIKFTGDHGPYTYYFVPEGDWSGPMEYADNTVGSAQVITGPGKYYVAVQDVKGCVDLTNIAAWDSAVVNDAPPALVIDTIYGEDPECIDGDGMVTVVVSGGYGGEYEVTLTGGVTETTVNDTAWFAVPEGSYTATAVDSNMCSVVSDSTVVLTDPAPITFDIALDDVACADSTTGSIYVFDITGPADSMIYGTLVGADTTIAGVYPSTDTIVFDGLAIGYYALYLNNENDACDSVAYDNPNGTGNVISVQAPGEITYDVVIDTLVCLGDSSVISIENVEGGSGSYEFSIDGGATYASTSEYKVIAGDYDVVVRDAAVSSCEIPYPTITLVDPIPVSIVSVDTISPTCPGGNDGVINITATGGTGDYEYSINGTAWYVDNIFAVPAGVYTTYVRDPLCDAIVASQTVMVDTLEENIIYIDEMDTAITCNGAADAWVDIDVDTWADQTGSDNRVVSIYMTMDESEVWVSGDSTTTGNYDDLGPGTYYFWASDNLGCMSKDYLTVEVTEADPLGVMASVTGVASCYGATDGTITVKLTGGTEPFAYGHANTWQAAMNLPDAAFTSWPAGADSVNINVGKGTYYVVVKDNCDKKVADGPHVVDGLEMVTITDTALAVTNIVCAGDSTGVIEVFAAEGGTEEFTYTLQAWIEGAWEDVAPYVDVTGTVYTGLPYGTYQVVVTDLGGCDGATTGNIDVDGPTQEVEIYYSWYNDISCNGAGDGLIEIWATGGTAPYQFKVNNNNWRDFPEGSDYKDIVVTEAGEYEVWVRDSLGCTSESETFIIDEPAAVVVTTDVVDVTNTCDETPNGELAITVSGGLLGEGYSLDYNIYVNDSLWSSHIGWPTGGGTYTYYDLPAGNYEVRVVENHGEWNYCEGFASAVITAPDTITGEAVVTETVLCNGGDNGEIVVSNIAGGTAPYHLYLTGPVTADMAYVDTSVNAFEDLLAGTYSVQIEDAEGCDLYINNIVVEEPVALTLNATHIQDVSCVEDGMFSVQATGGVGDYKYYAELSKLPEHILIPDPSSPEWQTDSIFSVTEAGTYIVWAMDANDCVIGGEEDDLGNPVNAWRVKVEAPEIEVDVEASISDNPACNGDLTASIIVNADDVTIYQDGVELVDPVYTVTIDGIATDTLENLGADTFYVVVTHESGCYGIDTVIFTEPEVLDVVLELGEGEFACPGDNSGYIEATATGGSVSIPKSLQMTEKSAAADMASGYEYQLWQDGSLKTDYQPTNSFLVTIDHDYVVVVMDANGCTDTSNVITINPVQPVELVDLMDVTCSSDTMASVKVTATADGDRQVYVKWTQFEAESGVYVDSTELMDQGEIVISQMFKFDNENVDDIHYEFQVIDEMGCMSSVDTMTFDQIITAPLELTVTQGEAGDCTTEVTVTAAGGVAPYTIMVNGEETTESVLMLGGGTYEISVMDAHECMVTEEVVIEYGISADTTLETYTGEAVQLVVEEAMLDTMLYAGEYSFYYDVDTACVAELNVTVTERDRMAPVLDTVTPMDTIETNHAVFTIVFEDVVTFNDSVMGYLTVTQKDSAEFTIEIPITADMVDGNTVTVDYDYEVVGMLDLNTTYTVSVDSGIVMGDGLAWDGVTGDWEFTTGADYPTGINPGVETVEFSVYPNPFNDFIRIDNADKLDRVIVSNIAGQRILDIEYPSYEIRTGNLTAGVYVVTLIADDEIVKSEKFLKR